MVIHNILPIAWNSKLLTSTNDKCNIGRYLILTFTKFCLRFARAYISVYFESKTKCFDLGLANGVVGRAQFLVNIHSTSLPCGTQNG